MKPPDFLYHRPTTRAEAAGLLAELGDEAKILAGGQSLIPMLNMRLTAPRHLIDINRVRDFPELELMNGDLLVGAGVRQREVETSPLTEAACPIVKDALAHVGHRAIRDRGTVVGSIVHADPAAELPAVLMILGGIIVIDGPSGSREVAAADFFQGIFETAVRDDELVSAVRFPRLGRDKGCAFLEIGRRRGDFALAGVAAVVGVDSAQVVVFGVEGRPQLFDAVDAIYGDTSVDSLLDDLSPLSDIHASADYRRHLASVLARRALKAASHRTATGSRDGLSYSEGVEHP